MERVADHWKNHDGGSITCDLCPHHCTIPPGGKGICGIRENRDGVLIATAYGLYPAVHIDPIEKKPLNHFLPGSSILSVGSIGCNLTCLHCQNWSLARAKDAFPGSQRTSPEQMAELALGGNSMGVAFTYNEPTINKEYIMDCAPILKKNRSQLVLVTNGYLEKGPWKELMGVTDAVNIDVKGFTDEFYGVVTGGKLQPVLDNVITAFDAGVHVEIAYLVIPGKNDDGQVDDFIRWVKEELDPEVPVHFNRFHPDHRMQDVPPTPGETLLDIRKRATEAGLRFIYIGNMAGKGLNVTTCPGCGKVLVDREGFLSPRVKIKNGSCPKCGESPYGVWN